MIKNFLTIAALLNLANIEAAEECPFKQPAKCYPDDCKPCHCLGPENYGVNAPTRPKTCNGDIVLTIAGLYWNAHQDGMEYAIDNAIQVPVVNPTQPEIQELNNLIEADYKTPKSKWDFGYRFGFGYRSACDGWDIGIVWTRYHGRSSADIEAEEDDNHSLIALWSAFSPAQGRMNYAREINAHWQVDLDLVDVELGREFWTSKYLTLRPHVGLRYTHIDQEFDLEHRGGSWSPRSGGGSLSARGGGSWGPLVAANQDPFNNEVDLDNDFKGVGIRSGLNTLWNFGCGWGLYGNFAASIIYGSFKIEHEEENRLATTPHSKTRILETEDHFRASRAIVDLFLGIQWSGLFCDCRYGIVAMLGWEHHLFFNQNQMWRVNRIGNSSVSSLPNNTGENVFHERRGDLDTQGWTLTFKFEF